MQDVRHQWTPGVAKRRMGFVFSLFGSWCCMSETIASIWWLTVLLYQFYSFVVVLNTTNISRLMASSAHWSLLNNWLIYYHHHVVGCCIVTVLCALKGPLKRLLFFFLVRGTLHLQQKKKRWACSCTRVLSSSLPGAQEWLSWITIGLGQLSARAREEIHHHEGFCLECSIR